MRLAALGDSGGAGTPSRRDVEAALRAHLCRCTGWQSIVEAACDALGAGDPPPGSDGCRRGTAAARDALLASWRAQTEGPAFQSSGPDVVLGDAGFADDTAPPGALVQLGADAALAPSVRAARAGRGRDPGPQQHGAPLPPGGAARRARGHSRCRPPGSSPPTSSPTPAGAGPRGLPASPLANGGAFGGKRRSPAPARARELADETGEAVRVLWRREDVVRHGPKRPPLAIGLRPDGTGAVRLGRTPGSAELGPLLARLRALHPGLDVEEVEVAGPPVAPELRGAGWAEVTAALHAVAAEPGPAGTGRARVTLPGAGSAEVALRPRRRRTRPVAWRSTCGPARSCAR